MTQESLSRSKREAQASDEIAAKLDALSRPMAERVLGRAIELDHVATAEAEAAADKIDYDTLRDVALEVGISEESLKKALLEELDTEKDRAAGPIERATVPDAIRGGLIVPGQIDEVIERLGRHLAGEGLRQQERFGPITIWRDPAHRTSRLPVTAWTVTQNSPNKQLVEVDVDTGETRNRVLTWVIAILVLGTLFGSALGGLILMGLFIAGIVATVGWFKRLARKARRSVNRALNSLIDDGKPPPDTWLELWERYGK